MLIKVLNHDCYSMLSLCPSFILDKKLVTNQRSRMYPDIPRRVASFDGTSVLVCRFGTGVIHFEADPFAKLQKAIKIPSKTAGDDNT